ncbi:hypothetical protein ZWY2020_040010 [Hordeum vulgare]|nr:hypothetical protein ZWY2020_040010 [Hordeum vulgare]
MYRIKPSVTHDPFHPRDPPNPRLLADFHSGVATPTQLQWSPPDLPTAMPGIDFVAGLYTVCGAGNSFLRHEFGVQMHAANKSLDGSAFCSADGDFLIVSYQRSREAVGVVTVLGLGLTGNKVGDVVAYGGKPMGSYAEE